MFRHLFTYKPLHTDLGLSITRVVFGLLFCYHGLEKILNYSSFSTNFPDPIGLGITTSLLLVIFAEFVGGVAVTLGLLTRFFLIPIFITMSVALFIVHAQDPFQTKELALLFWVISIGIYVTGPGKYSVDKLIYDYQYNKNKIAL